MFPFCCMYTFVYMCMRICGFLFTNQIFSIILYYRMDKLINKNIGLQNSGINEDEAWLLMLKKAQTKLFNAYKKKDTEAIDNGQKEVDFIQRQLIRLSQR